MKHNMNGMDIEVSNEQLKLIYSTCGTYMYTAVNAVLYYGQSYTSVGDVTTFTFGDGKRSYSIDNNGHFKQLDAKTGLMVDVDIKRNNRGYEVKAFRLLGGEVDIVDGKTLDGKNNNAGHTTIHQLIMAAFALDVVLAGCAKGYNEFNHINGCKHCNKLSNIEMCTTTENNTHGAALGIFISKGIYVADYDAVGFTIKQIHAALKRYDSTCKYTGQWVTKHIVIKANAIVLYSLIK